MISTQSGATHFYQPGKKEEACLLIWIGFQIRQTGLIIVQDLSL